MHHQACLFVDDDDVVVFVDDVQRDRLGRDVGLSWGIGEHDGNHIVGLHLVVLLDGFLINQDVACLGGILHTVARDVGEMVGQIGVDTLGLLAGVDRHAYVFVKLTAFFDFRKHVVLVFQGFVEVVVHFSMMNFWVMTWPSAVTI